MRRIAINMQNTLFCNVISETLRRSGNNFDTYTVDSPDKVADECKWLMPYALLMEVTGYESWRLSERMRIRDEVKAKNPECKIVIINKIRYLRVGIQKMVRCLTLIHLLPQTLHLQLFLKT